MNKAIRPLFLSLFLSFSTTGFACGTIDNWMDAYEGVESGNKWRDNSSQLDALVMMLDCGSGPFLKTAQQQRLLRVLSDAMSKRERILTTRGGNSDLRERVKRFKSAARLAQPFIFEGLIEAIYRRYRCLPDTQTTDAPGFTRAKPDNGRDQLSVFGAERLSTTLYQYFGVNSCPQQKVVHYTVKGSGGMKILSSPILGRAMASVKAGDRVEVVGHHQQWLRVLSPDKRGEKRILIGYLQKVEEDIPAKEGVTGK